MISLRQYTTPRTYARLPSGPEEDHESNVTLSRLKKSFFNPGLFHRFKIILVSTILITTVLLLILVRKAQSRRPKWTAPIYSFDVEPRPAWMSANSSSSSSPSIEPPLSIRVAVLSHSKEVKRRQLIRDYMFKGVRHSEIHIDYCFLVGLPNSWFGNNFQIEALRQEEKEHGDLVILDFKDSKYKLSEKRYFGLSWANSFSNVSYDYFMTLDSDTFVRFGALARRLPTLLEGQNIMPREQPVIIARMSPQPHWRYWLTTVSDQSKDTTEEDIHLDGPTFLYPIGIGYMLSSSLVQTLLSTQYPLPHHIHYPYDDVMVGSWLASLKHFADPSSTFTTPPTYLWNNLVKVRPNLLLPTRLDTTIIDDKLGWHDYPGRAYVNETNGAIGWNSVCIHHVKGSEIKMMREMKEFRGEWDD